MPDILIRGLESETIRKLKARAKQNGRSLQGEAKRLLEEASSTSDEDVRATCALEAAACRAEVFQQRAVDPRGPEPMRTAVIDASVVVAAFLSESHSDAAQSLLASGRPLYAPEFVYTEVANVIWKRFRRGEVDEREAADLLRNARRLRLQITPSEQLLAPALGLAMQTGRTVYDCLYVALAVQINSVMLTNDQRLANALASGPLKRHVAWLGQLRVESCCNRTAASVLCKSIVTVSNPTPPGTGVICEATSFTPAKSTSPTRPVSSRFMPTSITTAPGLTMSAVTNRGRPMATMRMSAPHAGGRACGCGRRSRWRHP